MSKEHPLKILRKEILGMSQRQFAKAIGIRQGTISDWELRNTLKPSLTIEQSQKLDLLLKEKGMRISDIKLD